MDKKDKYAPKGMSISTKITALFIITVILVTGCSLYLSVRIYRKDITNQIAVTNCLVADSICEDLSHMVDVTDYADRIMGIYSQMPQDVWEDLNSPEYRSYFSDMEREGGYKHLNNVLKSFRKSGLFRDVYIMMYDDERELGVYIVDPDESNNKCELGEYEYVDPKNFEGYCNSTSKKPFVKIYDSNGTSVMTTAIKIEGEGKEKCVLMMDIPMNDISRKERHFAFTYILSVVLILLLIVIFISFFGNRTIALPIRKISRAAKHYANNKQQGKERKWYFDNLKIKTKDELGDLSDILKEMEKDINDHEDELVRVTAENGRISAELNLATEIQASMLPNVFPAFPERDEFDLYATMTPAKEVGGDFYDFFMIDDNHLGMVMADVSGKGVPAALFMMMAKIHISNYAHMGFSPAETLKHVNETICADNDVSLFVTVWFGILDITTGEIVAANGGHDYPAVKHGDGDFEIAEGPHGVVVGIMEGVNYTNYTITLEKGSTILLYTDGVPEAKGEEKEMYGLDRMIDTLNNNKSYSPKSLIESIHKDVEAFVKDAEQFDDITMLCVTYRGPKEEL